MEEGKREWREWRGSNHLFSDLLGDDGHSSKADIEDIGSLVDPLQKTWFDREGTLGIDRTNELHFGAKENGMDQREMSEWKDDEGREGRPKDDGD